MTVVADVVVADVPVRTVADRKEWRWLPDPAEAEGSGPHPGSGSGSTWKDNVLRAMAWARLFGTW